MLWNGDGWRFKFDDGIATLSPDADELQKKINAAACELSRRIAQIEQTLMLNALGDESLEKLISLCKVELEQRAEFRAKLFERKGDL